MRRIVACHDVRGGLLLAEVGTQRATMMLDRAPLTNGEATPYQPSERDSQPLGFDVMRSKDASNARDEDPFPKHLTRGDGAAPSAADKLADIRRWQQSRIRSKTTVESAQHVVGYASRLTSGASYLASPDETDHMRVSRERLLEKRRLEQEEDIRLLQEFERNRTRDTDGLRFQRKKDELDSSIDDLINFPTRVLEAEAAAFDKERQKELAMALHVTPAVAKSKTLERHDVGSLTVVNLADSSAGAKRTQPKGFKPLHPSRLLIKQLSVTVPRSHPYAPSSAGADGEASANGGLLMRSSSNDGALIASADPPCTHAVAAHKLSRGAAIALASAQGSNAAALGTAEEVAARILEEDDVLLASHRFYAQQEEAEQLGARLRHPQAVNLNRSGAPQDDVPPSKPIIQAAIEGDDDAFHAGGSRSTGSTSTADEIEAMTPLERQRYYDVLETQRQADIADALTKAKAYESDTRRKNKATKYGSSGASAAHHNKFAHANDPSLKEQHAYLQKLLERKDIGFGSNPNNTDTMSEVANSNGVQWIGTTPKTMGKRFHAFMLRVLGSSVFLGALLYLNPSLLDPPRENLYVDVGATKRSDILNLTPKY